PSGSAARLAARKLERETGPGPGLAVEQDSSAVRLHDVAHDRETQPGTADVARLRGLREALEDALLLVRRDTRPGVAPGDADVAVLGPRVDHDPSAGGRVPKRVREQVRERPGELDLVADHAASSGRGRFYRDVLFLRLRGEDAHHPIHDRAELDVAALERD